MSDRVFSTEQKAKLTQIINEGMQVMHEVETLNAGLSDTIKAIAEEIEIKPSILKKAIKLAHKAGLLKLIRIMMNLTIYLRSWEKRYN